MKTHIQMNVHLRYMSIWSNFDPNLFQSNHCKYRHTYELLAFYLERSTSTGLSCNMYASNFFHLQYRLIMILEQSQVNFILCQVVKNVYH